MHYFLNLNYEVNGVLIYAIIAAGVMLDHLDV